MWLPHLIIVLSVGIYNGTQIAIEDMENEGDGLVEMIIIIVVIIAILSFI